MKQRFLFLFTLLVTACLSANAYDFMVDSIAYNINSDEISVTVSGGKKTGSLTIPEKVTYEGKNYSVTSIGYWAFYLCSELTGDLIIPNSVTSIGTQAFCGCSGFTGSLIIPNSVISIGFGAFSSCSGFTGDLSIPSSVTSIGESAFSWCSGFTGSLTIGDSVTSIGKDAFYECRGFTGSLIIPNSVISIGFGAFSSCSGFTGSLAIPNSVTSIGGSAFSGCSGLTGSLTIGNSVTSIGNSAFPKSFSSVKCLCSIPPKLGNFLICTPLQVPSGCKEAYRNANNWGNIKQIFDTDIAFFTHNGIQYSINDDNNTVTLIGPVNKCDITELSIPETVEYNSNSYKVTIIKESAFSKCSLRDGKIIIPKYINDIGDYVFQDMDGYSSIICYNTTPPVYHSDSPAFPLTLKDVPLYVPEKSISSYKNAAGWKNYTKIYSTTIQSVSLVKHSLTLPDGIRETLVATVTPSTALNKKLSWTSSDSSVLTVDDNGTVSTISPGSAVVKASSTDGTQIADSCAITVTIGVKSISLDKKSMILIKGQSDTLKVDIAPDNAANKNIKWSTSNLHATVSNGVVTGNGLGSAIIYARTQDGTNLMDSCEVTVISTINVKSVSLDKETMNLFEGQSETLKVDIAPDNATNKNINWSTSNSRIATVGSDGVVKGVSSGTAIITATTTDGTNLKADCEVAVYKRFSLNGIVYEVHKSSTPEVHVCANLDAGKSYQNLSGEIIIPEKVTKNGISFAVTYIGENAFQGNTTITSVILPNTIISIEKGAFSGSSITSIKLSSELQSIGEDSFSKCSKLIRIEIPEQVKDISSHAFSGCLKLSNIDFNDKITIIGRGAFKDCIELTSVVLPADLETINTSAFENCTSLSSVQFGKALKTIGEKSFYGCSALTAIKLSNVITISGSAFLGCSKLTFAHLGENLTTIGANAFSSSALSEITIPGTVNNIGDYAFQYCSGLAVADIEEGVKNIGKFAFSNTALVSINIPSSITELDEGCFSNCSSLVNYVISDTKNTLEIKENYRDSTYIPIFDNTPLRYVYLGRNISCQESPFSNMESLTSVVIGKEVTTILPKFIYNCINVKKLTIPENVTSIGEEAFGKCLSIAELTFKAIACNDDKIDSFEKSWFRDCSNISKIVLGEKVKVIPSFFAAYKSLLKNIIIPDSVYLVKKDAFNDCALESLTLPEQLETIEENAFKGNKFNSLILTAKHTKSEAFGNCSELTSLVVKDRCEDINSRCFVSTPKLHDVNIESVKETLTIDGDSSLFASSNLNKVFIGRDVIYEDSFSPFRDQANLKTVTFSNNGFVTVCPQYMLYKTGVENIDFPESVTLIKEYAFAYCKELSAASFKDKIQAIEHCAFIDDTSLSSVKLNNCQQIGDSAFYNCTNANEILVSNCQQIGESAFYNCTNANEILVSNCQQIGESAFYNCTNSVSNYQQNGDSALYKCTISVSNCQQIGESAFYNCTNANEISVSNCSTISKSAFSHCGAKSTKLNTIDFVGDSAFKACNVQDVILNDCKIIGNYAFSDCNMLQGISIPSETKELRQFAFANCGKLKTADIAENSVSVLNKGLFEDCPQLETVTIPASVNKIAENVFHNCTSLDSVCFRDGDNVLQINTSSFKNAEFYSLYLGRWLAYDDSPFMDMTKLKNVTFGTVVKSINKNCFNGCSSIERIIIPDQITSVGLKAFMGCSSLSELKLGNNLASLGEACFMNCTSLESVIIPASLPAISESTFENCTLLKNVDFGEVNTIAPRAFYNTALTKVSIPSTLYGLGVESFRKCNSLTDVVLDGTLRSVGAQSFMDCKNLAHITLGKKITSLGKDCFAGCPSIQWVISYNTMSPEGVPNFVSSVVSSATLYVPEYSIEIYSNSPTWENWFNIKSIDDKPDDTQPGDVDGDGETDINDANILINIILGKDSTEKYNGRADADGSGEVDVTDANWIINKILGK